MCIIFLILEKIVFEIYIKFVDNVFFVVFFCHSAKHWAIPFNIPPHPIEGQRFLRGREA